MPRKSVKRKDIPELFAKVYKVINGQKNKRSYITVYRIAKEILAKLEQMGLKPDSRNVLIKVRRALEFGVQNNMFLYKAKKYRIAVAGGKSKSPKKEPVPLDSFELLKSQKSQRRSRKVDEKKHKCTRQNHTASCRKRYRKQNVQQNKRHLSRKCKSQYFVMNKIKSSKESLNSDTSGQLGGSTGEHTTAENKSELGDFQNTTSPLGSSDIKHWDNKQEAIDRSKYGKQSRKSRIHLSSYHGSASNTDESKSHKNKKRKAKNLKMIENLSNDNVGNGLSTSTAIAAAIMIMMSLWYGYR